MRSIKFDERTLSIDVSDLECHLWSAWLSALVCGGRVVVLGEVVQYSFVEGGKHVEFSGGHQVDEVPADVLHVPGRRLLDGSAAGRQQADHGAAGVVGIGFTA